MFRGDRLKELRKSKKLTQVELGKLVKLSHSMITRYEKGDYQPDADTINKFADIFNVSTDYLLGRVEESDIALMEGEEIPKELRELGMEYIKVTKEFKERGFTPEEIKEFLNAIEKLNRK